VELAYKSCFKGVFTVRLKYKVISTSIAVDKVEITQNYRRKEPKMATKKIRIRLKAYEHRILDAAAEKIVETAKRTNAEVSGPIPLPTDRSVYTVIRATHKYKDSREQFEMRTHKRLIDIIEPTQKTVDSLMKLDLPSGVNIEIKL